MITTTTPIPDYIPSAVKSRLAGRRFSLHRLPEVVRRRMRTAERMRVSEHAARYRVVTEPPHTGPWRHEYAPHTVKIMDTYGLPWVREIWFCAPEQGGKTATAMNCMHWAADCDPGNIFYSMPNETDRDKVTSGKIIPMIKASPRLSKYLTGREADATLARIKLNHGVTILPAHANSPSSLATWAAKHVFGDEVDKYPMTAGKEADPITLLRKRTRLYRGRYKRFFVSTPAGRFIYKGVWSCPQVWVGRLRCPHCDLLIKPTGDHLNLDEITTEMIEAGHPVTFSCPECGAAINEQEREIAIRSGRWLAAKGGDIVRPSRVGFHQDCFWCLDIPLAEIAVAWLKAKTGNHNDKVAWANGYETIDYEPEQTTRDEDFIKRLIDPAAPRKVVPRDTQLLLVLADTQQIGFHYDVVAFGWGETLPMAVIDHGYVETFAQLNAVGAKVYHDAEGKEFRAFCGFVDSGGGTNPHKPKHSRTVEVYQHCRANPFWRPLKGRRTMETGWNIKRLDFYPASVGKKVPIPGGLNLYTINVTLSKNELARKLQIERDDAGAIVLHAEITSDWCRQLCAEYQDERGYWECARGRDNHHWDILVYAIAAAEILRLRDRRPEGQAKPGRRIISKGVTSA